jgi:urease accessory protein
MVVRQFKTDKKIVERILGNISDVHHDGHLEFDPVIMDHIQIQKPHQKAVTQNGRVVAISLEQGMALKPGAVLYLDNHVVVYVDLPEEDVLEIRPHGNMEWGRAAYNIGNMHQPAYIYEEMIRCPYDIVLERVMLQLGIPCQRKSGKLDGVRANVSAGHSHGTVEGHGPEHVHDHEQNHHHGE